MNIKYKNSLHKALLFLAPVKQLYIKIANNKAYFFNDKLYIAYPVDENFTACPHLPSMLSAIANIDDAFAITNYKLWLTITDDKTKATINCLDVNAIKTINLDFKASIKVDNLLKTHIRNALKTLDQKSNTKSYNGVLFTSNSVVGTNGLVLVESWHGLNLPISDTFISKDIAKIIATSKFDLTGLSTHLGVFVFHFDDAGVIASTVTDVNFPPYLSLFSTKQLDVWAPPDDFFVGAKMLNSLTLNSTILLNEGVIKSGESSYQIDSLNAKLAIDFKLLNRIKEFCNQMAFDEERNCIYFFNDQVRGVLAGIKIGDKIKTDYDLDDDIPF